MNRYDRRKAEAKSKAEIKAGVEVRSPVSDGKRTCGECSLCCELLFIPELNKPTNKLCEHCPTGSGGCSIYDSRPESCRGFKCEWLMGRLSEEWHPLRSGIVADFVLGSVRPEFRFYVDPRHPLRWREEPYYSHIKRTAQSGWGEFLTIVIVDNDITFILLNGEVRHKFDATPEEQARCSAEIDRLRSKEKDRLEREARSNKDLIDSVLLGRNDDNVIVGPLLLWPEGGDHEWYFMVATSKAGTGFGCEPILTASGNNRSGFIRTLRARGGLVIHDMGHEVVMARLCETLWPGPRTMKLRQNVEAEYASRADNDLSDQTI